MKWPNNKEFAFTVVDDTDNSTVDNVGALYNYLASKNIKTTKTVWVYPSRNKFKGQCIQDEAYFEFLQNMEKQGFEIQLHNVGSGYFSRDEIIEGLNIFKEKFGRYPKMQINHHSNSDNLYWGPKRFGPILKPIMKLLIGKKRLFYGDEEQSEQFWGDLSKEKIKFIRNRIFNGINTLKYDPKMPFKEKNKKYSNYWFSSSDGHTVEEFSDLISKENIDKLKRQNGLCIVYTHFASGFVETNGEVNKRFKDRIEYLSEQNGWFVPASEILEYLISQKKNHYTSQFYINMLDFKWSVHRLIKKIKYGR